MVTKAVFVDRDGTIARDVNYCRRPEDFEILPSAPQAIRLLNKNGFKVVVITNQSGIARGYFTEDTLAQIHGKMESELARHGARLDAIYYCPHHPDDGCDCRKPEKALFLRAAKELHINSAHSFMIGDMQMDIDAGKALGCKTVLVTTGPNGGNGIINPPDFTADSLLEAAQWIIRNTGKKISIVIPALNERDGIGKTIQTIPQAELEDMGYEVQILVVDNGSNDGTSELAMEAGAEVVFEPRCGYGYAYKAGFTQAKGDIIVTVDADATYPAEDIPRLIRILERDKLDFLTTNRFALMEKDAMSFRNRLGNRILSLTVNLLFWLNMRDPESGMWVFRRHILGKLRLGSNIWPFSHEIKLEACYFNKYRWEEVPIQYKDRIGDTKLADGWKVGLTDLFHIIRKRVIR